MIRYPPPHTHTLGPIQEPRHWESKSCCLHSGPATPLLLLLALGNNSILASSVLRQIESSSFMCRLASGRLLRGQAQPAPPHQAQSVTEGGTGQGVEHGMLLDVVPAEEPPQGARLVPLPSATHRAAAGVGAAGATGARGSMGEGGG